MSFTNIVAAAAVYAFVGIRFTKTISFWPSGPIDVYERITDRHIRAVKKIFYEVFATDASILTRNVHATSYDNH